MIEGSVVAIPSSDAASQDALNGAAVELFEDLRAGGTCAFSLCSVSVSGSTSGFYLWFRSSELPLSSDSEAA